MIGIKNVIAIICGGGPAPGINSVISAVVSEATRHGWDVLGIYDGFSRIARGEKNYVRLEPANISRIHLTGGCILKMSRFNPTKKESDLRTVVETLTELGVTHLVTIGGDDTAFSSMAVSEYARKMGRTINVVHVPKTIDNDLPLPEGVPTFGFETARAFGTMEIENLMDNEMETHHHEAMVPAHSIQKMADGLPAFGIVAAVMGVVHTMGSVGQPPAILGEMIAHALVGTFLGILMAYGFVGPLADVLTQKTNEAAKELQCVKVTLLASMQGYAPAICVEFGRKVLYSTERPGFAELEGHVKQKRA